MTSHSIKDCISLLKSQTAAHQAPKVFDFLQDFEESGFDPLLGTISNLLERETVPHVLSFLRTFRVLDVSDCELITNRNVYKTTQEEIIALVDSLNTKGPHAYWFFVHAMERLNQDFFIQMHGKLVCCGKQSLMIFAFIRFFALRSKSYYFLRGFFISNHSVYYAFTRQQTAKLQYK